MIHLPHEQHALSDRFIAYMLARNLCIEADLVDQLFNATEKRLARTLLLLAGYGKPEQTHRVLPRISQETLADMIGATRPRVNFLMNKFKKLGFVLIVVEPERHGHPVAVGLPAHRDSAVCPCAQTHRHVPAMAACWESMDALHLALELAEKPVSQSK